MQIVRSTIAADEILTVIIERYGFDDRAAFCLLEYRGVNDVYKYTAGDRSYYLKIYARRDVDREAIQGEVEVVNYLHQAGLPVTFALPMLDEGFVSPFDTPEGTRYGVLFTEAEGTPCNNDTLDDQQTAAIGALVSRMHSLLGAMPGSPRHWKLDEQVFLGRSFEILDRYSQFNRQVDLPFLQEVVNELKDQIRKNGGNWKWGLSHGDFYTGNIHQKPNGELTILDFDFCGYGWRAYDVSPFLGNFSAGVRPEAIEQRKRRLDHFLRGYQLADSLSDGEVEAVYRVFVPFRRIFNLGYLYEVLLNVWGNKARSWQTSQDLRLLKEWIDYYW